MKVGHLDGAEESRRLSKGCVGQSSRIDSFCSGPSGYCCYSDGGAVFDIASIAVSVLLGQAPWQKAGLQPGMLGGDPE